MNDGVSPIATLTAQPTQSAQAERPTALWVLAAAFVVITAVAVLVADRSLTPEQRFAVFLQSGMVP